MRVDLQILLSHHFVRVRGHLCGKRRAAGDDQDDILAGAQTLDGDLASLLVVQLHAPHGGRGPGLDDLHDEVLGQYVGHANEAGRLPAAVASFCVIEIADGRDGYVVEQKANVVNGIVGDVFEVIPELIRLIKEKQQVSSK